MSSAWSGFYFGAHVGHAWSDGYFDDEGDNKNFEFDASIFGGQIGYDVQRGNYVFGIVGDYAKGDLEDDYSFGPSDAYSREAEIGAIGTIRGRIGYAVDRWLVYGTAGVAFVEAEIKAVVGGGPDNPKMRPAKEDDFTTWVAGVGIEKQLGEGISLFAEYIHIGLDEEINGASGFDEGPFVFEEIDLVKVGVNVRLGHEATGLK